MRRTGRRGAGPGTGLTATLALVALLSACAGGGADSAEEGGWIDGPPPTPSADGEFYGTDGAASATADRAGEPGAPAPAVVGGEADAAAPGSPPIAEESPVTSGPLRAGSVDDNTDFADYLAYRQTFLTTGIAIHDQDVTERHVVAVTNADGRPVLGATVTLTAGDRTLATVRTTADGSARIFPLAAGASPDEPITLTITLGDQTETRDVGRGSARHEFTLAIPTLAPPIPLDVHFLLDATGSMGDELDRLKATIADVVGRIGDLPSETDLRLSLTAYRDLGDAYVTRTFDFTNDVESFAEALGQVVAEGGGDEPEALSEALQSAVDEPTWRDGQTVKLMFLVADAPPQLDRDADYAVEMVRAAERGIMIVPLASSGLSDQGEYVFRQLALTTGGPFLFLTYGADGAPGDDTPHHVSGYDVLSLDELVVEVITDQLAHLAGEPVTPPQQ